jgi:hypothetical protein
VDPAGCGCAARLLGPRPEHAPPPPIRRRTATTTPRRVASQEVHVLSGAVRQADHHAGGCHILWMAAKESSKIKHMEALTRPSKVGAGPSPPCGAERALPHPSRW